MRTAEEMREIDEKNYHGCILAVFGEANSQDRVPTVREVLDTIERRFGVTNPVQNHLTTIEIAEVLSQELTSAMEHLRPDTVDWFKQRMTYVLQCAAARVKPQ